MGHLPFFQSLAAPQDMSRRQGGRSGAHVDHCPAGEVQSAQLSQPTPAPDPVSQRRIDHQQPQQGKQDHGRKFDALGIGPGNKGWGEAGKHALEGHEQNVGMVSTGPSPAMPTELGMT